MCSALVTPLITTYSQLHVLLFFIRLSNITNIIHLYVSFYYGKFIYADKIIICYANEQLPYKFLWQRDFIIFLTMQHPGKYFLITNVHGDVILQE